MGGVDSPDGKTLASAGDDRMVKVWDATTGQEIRTLRGHAESVIVVAYSPDGKTLVSAGSIRRSGSGMRIRAGRSGAARACRRGVGRGL